eukprot:3041702-Amphidinium_carterae.1
MAAFENASYTRACQNKENNKSFQALLVQMVSFAEDTGSCSLMLRCLAPSPPPESSKSAQTQMRDN